MLRCTECGEEIADGTTISVSHRGWQRHTGEFHGTVSIQDTAYVEAENWEESEFDPIEWDDEGLEEMVWCTCPECGAEHEGGLDGLFEWSDEEVEENPEKGRFELVGAVSPTSYGFYVSLSEAVEAASRGKLSGTSLYARRQGETTPVWVKSGSERQPAYLEALADGGEGALERLHAELKGEA